MALPPQSRDAAARELGSLALSVVRVDNPMLGLRAAQWRNGLVRVGLDVPFWAVHDVGMLALVDPEAVPLGPRPSLARLQLGAGSAEALADYAETLMEIGQSEVLETARQWRLGDDLISVLLLRVLGPLWERFRGPQRRGQSPALLPLDPEVYRDLEPQLPELFRASDREDDVGFLEHVARERLRLITAVEQIDLDTLRLLGMFGAEANAANALNVLDLLNVFESPEANDIVNFSLDLLPSVLETKRASGQQSFAVDGYSGVERRGTLDSLVLSELAFVDASASMRGQRAVFARGLALTLIKQLHLQGEDVYFRFFDSRLYEVQHARAGRSDTGGISVPYVLCFKGERGRNYAKVFGLLANDLQRLQRRERRSPILSVLTHAQCHVPVETVDRLRSIARLYGVFMLPSEGRLELDYASRRDTLQVVDEASLFERDARAKRALEIVDDAAKTREPLVDEDARVSRARLPG